ncbi:DUF1090 domain-containing protein [Variovorax sp. IB41]|uniref:DUF1090 domain-containing protein n=1 Tax=Variovorax sp. IB41 TaxID=2779370 RepID=UPI0018E7BABB|nr:DUF1090 domain-containing protein [Variovorax sp. IB41]
MRHLLPSILVAALATLSLSAAAQPITSESCNAKREAIERDIDAAKAKGQAQRVRGLERAMSANQRNCSEERLQAEHRKRVQAQERKVAERQRELAQANEKGRADKIAQREGKLREEEAELEKLKAAH